MSRLAEIKRTTTETSIELSLNIDGSGKSIIDTPVPFLNHMLTLFSKHGLFDLNVKATGDIEIDAHHTVEDIGIVLGQAFKQALGNGYGIKRYAQSAVPMDETLVITTVDLSGRAYLVYNVYMEKGRVGNFDTELAKEFFQAFANNAAINLHINMQYGDNLHHIIEACFKSCARAMREASSKDDRLDGVMSTKGQIL